MYKMFCRMVRGADLTVNQAESGPRAVVGPCLNYKLSEDCILPSTAAPQDQPYTAIKRSNLTAVVAVN